MASKFTKGTFPIFIILLVVVVVLSGCQMPYSTAPKATPTKIVVAETTFPEPIPTGQDPMAMVGDLATGSAIAMMQTAGTQFVTTPPVAATTPAGIEIIPVGGTPGVPTSTLPVLSITTPTTPAASGITPQAVVSTPVPGSVPASYTLQGGEFPYCIARRYNLNPDELLNLNGLADGGLYMPGLTLRLPQTGNPFPASRALRSHPAAYTVAGTGETFHSVACLFGDVDPSALASYNSLSVGSVLSVGQTLQIP